ncbi:GFA family protein [Sphingomonas sp.]|uniref:GFA family protein n=1 Tax=Sphingomonas sp. TaxID=28214 RepID=UPI0025E2CBF1|nr:GFA family protein [Sphingomonas sp.]
MRVAECRCGAVKVACAGEPVRVSVCHCLNCQRRSGSAFAVQARWPEADVEISGETREWTVTGESGGVGRFLFCPVCGGNVAYTIDAMPGLVAVPVGAFADPDFQPMPEYSVYEGRMWPWVKIEGEMEHWD